MISWKVKLMLVIRRMNQTKTSCSKSLNEQKSRKRAWKDLHIDDMIDIIVNNEKYKKKLIFTNVKKQKIVRYMKVF